MQKFIAVTALVAVAHAAELLTDAEQYTTPEPIDPKETPLIDDGKDTAADMGANRQYYKKGNYDEFDEDDDKHSQPLCSIPGFQDMVDNKGPSDQCCRTYDFIEFKGNYRDWCLYEDFDAVTWKNVAPKAYDLDQLGWHDDISSWKCGSKVMIKMCAHNANESDYDANYDTSENCTEGHNLNGDMAADSQVMDTLWVKPQPVGPPGDAECVATVYEKNDCKGQAFLIRSDIRAPGQAFSTLDKEQKWMGSWDHYDSQNDTLLAAGKIRSVMFKEIGAKRCVVEFFNDNNFKGDSVTLKSNVANGETCYFVPEIHPVIDQVSRDRWSENTGPDFVNEITSGVHSIQIRHEYFPDM